MCQPKPFWRYSGRKDMENKKITKIRLQKASTKDIPKLLEIENSAANTKIYSAMTDEKEWKQELNNNNATVYFILKNKVIVGNASYERKNNAHACISGLVISPEFQGMGIGRETIRLILEELKDVKIIELVTHPENEVAIKLYLSFGFIIKSRKENYFGDGEPRIIMVKKQ